MSSKESPESAEQAPSAPPPAAPRPATALLFQAPDLSVVPPRAKARPAPEPEPSSRDKAESSSDSDDNDTQSETSPDDDQSSSAAKKRRRRGGRGRGRTGSSKDSSDDDGDDSDDSDSTDDSANGSDSRASKSNGRSGGSNQNSAKNGSKKSSAADDDGEDSSPADSDSGDNDSDSDDNDEDSNGSSSSRRRRRRRRTNGDGSSSSRDSSDEVTGLKGSTRLEAKRQRRRDGRDSGRRRQVITEAEFLARRESVDRHMVVRELNGRTQIAVLEDNVLVEHYVSQQEQASLAGNVYLGRVQNVLPSMEAAFVDIGKGRNAVLYAGEVNWDAAGLDGQPRRIEQALKSGDSVLVQVTKDPIGHKGARLTSQVTLAGRFLVYVPGGGMTGISRKLPDVERNRLKKILREIVPDSAGVIVRTAAEGASEEELTADIARLQTQWERIEKKSKTASAPSLLQGEPDLAIRVIRDIFNDDFAKLVVAGGGAWSEITEYLEQMAPDLAERAEKWTGKGDVFSEYRVDEQLAKGMDRKVWLPSGGSLVIDRTEAMTVVDVNTGKFTGSGGTLEETVTKNNLEAAEEIVRQLRLRDIGGIIVIDFIDMVLESNRDLVLRRLVECLGRDRTKHQVAEVTSLGLVQMTRKRVGQGLVEAFSENCTHCNGRGFIVHAHPIERSTSGRGSDAGGSPSNEGRKQGKGRQQSKEQNASADAAAVAIPVLPEADSKERESVKATLAQIAAAAAHAHDAQDEQDSAAADAKASGQVTEDAPAAAPKGRVKAASKEDSKAAAKDASAGSGKATKAPKSLAEIVLPVGPVGSGPAENAGAGDQPKTKPKRRRVVRPQVSTATPPPPPPPPTDMA